MAALPFIDVHSHNPRAEKDTVRVVNLFPGASIPEFTGKLFYSIGLHPWKIGTMDENNLYLEMIKDALEFDHVIFIGECGIDKVYGGNLDEQTRVFMAHAMMAEEYQKPLIIHCIRAYNEIIEIYNKIAPSVPWIFHGYTGNPELSAQLLNKGFLFSFGKILYNPKAKAVDSFRNMSIQNIFLETDEFNGPVSAIYEIAAAIRNIDVEEMKKAVWENFNRLENVSFTTTF